MAPKKGGKKGDDWSNWDDDVKGDDYKYDDYQYKEDDCKWEACYDKSKGENECWVEHCTSAYGDYDCNVYYVDENEDWQEITCEEGMAMQQMERLEKLGRVIEGFNQSLAMTGDFLCPEGKCIVEPLMAAEMEHNITGKVDDMF